MSRDVKVRFWASDREWAAVECFCGYGAKGLEFVVGINQGWGCVCPKCGREYYYDLKEDKIITYPNGDSYNLKKDMEGKKKNV